MNHEPIQAMFSRAAANYPTRVAIHSAGKPVTYGELAQRCNNLANFLIASGAIKGSVVSIMTDDPVDRITAIIGTLKSGCAFVPLDPGIPEKRLETMLSLASPGWLLIASRLFPSLARIEFNGRPRAKIICLDRERIPSNRPGDWTCLNGYGEYSNPEEPAVPTAPDDLCYIYFTSGSTGRPKGIAGRLQGIDHFIRWEIQALGIRDGVRVSQLLSPSFDGSLRDIFVPLCTGGTLCPPDGREAILDATTLIDWIDRQQINLIHCVPSLFRSILNEALHPGLFSSLRHIVMAGEPLLPSDVGRWVDVFGERIQLVNLYGTSETTMAKFAYFVKPSDRSRRSIPIGKPIPGAKALLLDEKGKPCPPGLLGEVYIRTPYRSLGYYAQPELTREVFIPNPFRNDPDDLIYKTGDLARQLEDGNFEFLGRKDKQVKIRGVRVELGEIENLLRAHAAIKDVAVIDREDGRGDNYLCAYVVLQAEIETMALREFLAQHLPDYMLPSCFVVLTEMPRTVSGKIDRQALPPPGEGSAGSDKPFVAPRSDVEKTLAEIWTRVLGVERVGIHDNFFHLGGHSLRATQVVSRVRTAFNIAIPLRSLFEEPTVAGLAERIETALGNRPLAPERRIARVPRDGALPLSFAQQRLWFLHQLDPNSPAYNMPAAVRLLGPLDVSALEQTLNAIVDRHETLRTTFALVDGQPVQNIAPRRTVPLPVMDLRGCPPDEREAEAQRQAIEEARRPFDMAGEPLLRVLLIRLDEEEHVAVLTMHHIISDAWSVGLLVKEIAAFYEAFSTNQPAPLDPLPIQYADFAVWQRTWLQGPVLEAQLAYWKRRLAGLPKLALRTDYPRPAVQTYRGATEHFSLPQALSDGLKDLSRKEGVTLFMILLAAFQTLLYRDTNQEDIVVGTDVAHRNQDETEGLIGFFVNQLVLRTDLSGHPTFRELLQRVREVALGAFAHQDLPFEKIVEALNPERDLSSTLMFQVKLVLENAPIEALNLKNLAVRPMPLRRDTARYDLTLFFWEAGSAIRGSLQFNTSLFTPGAITRMIERLITLLGSIVAQPDARLLNLEIFTEAEKMQQLSEQKERAESNLRRFKSIKPRAVSLSEHPLVKTTFLRPEAALPLVIEPDGHGMDLAAWAKSHLEFLDRELLKAGAILFQGFTVDAAAEFEQFALAVCPELFKENGEHTRQTIQGHIYTPVFYPPDKQLLWHNENSFNESWPAKIFFCCANPPQRGGETPIVDSREVFRRIDPRIREQFMRKNVMYVRNYGNGLGLDWQEVFQTADRSEVVARCQKSGMGFEWKAGNRLRTYCLRPSTVNHPKTGEMVWFNQAQHWHPSCLEPEVRDAFAAAFAEEDLPRNCYYGDGSPIEDSVMAEICAVYKELEVSFPWQKGDILMLDNLLTAHGRNPFAGERRILVAMGDMLSYAEVQSSESLALVTAGEGG